MHLVKSSVPLVNNVAKHSRSMLNNSSLNFLYIPSEDKVEFPMDSTSDENVNTRMCPNPIKYTDKPNTPPSDHNNLPKSSQKSTDHSPTKDPAIQVRLSHKKLSRKAPCYQNSLFHGQLFKTRELPPTLLQADIPHIIAAELQSRRDSVTRDKSGCSTKFNGESDYSDELTTQGRTWSSSWLSITRNDDDAFTQSSY